MEAPTLCAATRALAIPEILETVIWDYLDNDRPRQRSIADGSHFPVLFRFMLVNKMWLPIARAALWHEPPLSAFLNLPEHRQTFYSRNVRRLAFRFKGDTEAFARLDAFSLFRSVEHVKIEHVEWVPFSVPSPAVVKTLLPNLKSLRLDNVCLPEDFFQLLHDQCHFLESLSILEPVRPRGSASRPRINRDSFFKFLQDQDKRPLVEIKLALGVHSMPEGKDIQQMKELVKGIVQANTVISVDLSSLLAIDKELTQHISSTNFFSRLEKLACAVDCYTLRELGMSAGPVRRLKLEITDQSVDAIEPLGALVNLEELSLNFLYRPSLSSKSLCALSQLTRLRTLKFKSRSAEDLEEEWAAPSVPDFADQEFISIVSNMRYLEHLEFYISSDISVVSLDALGSSCRLLRELIFQDQSFDLHDLGESSFRKQGEVLFPRLRVFLIKHALDTKLHQLTRGDVSKDYTFFVYGDREGRDEINPAVNAARNNQSDYTQNDKQGVQLDSEPKKNYERNAHAENSKHEKAKRVEQWACIAAEAMRYHCPELPSPRFKDAFEVLHVSSGPYNDYNSLLRVKYKKASLRIANTNRAGLQHAQKKT